jgi:hypothetical protein
MHDVPDRSRRDLTPALSSRGAPQDVLRHHESYAAPALLARSTASCIPPLQAGP